MNKLAAIRIVYEDGTYSDPIPITALMENIQWNESKSLLDVLGEDLNDDGESVKDKFDRLKSLVNNITAFIDNIPEWAKQPNKPTYTAQEVGALPADTQITIEVDNTLSIQGAAADAKKVGDELIQIGQDLENQQSRAETAQALKINKPITNPNGTNGQILQTDGQGGTVWVNKQTNEQIANAVTDWLDDHVVPGSSTIIVDDTLTTQGAAADAKKTGDELSALKEEISHIGGLSEDIKVAMLQIASKVAYIDEHGQDYYDDLYDALYPPADLVSISAVYTQSGTVYNTDTLDSLKADLVVTAHMPDQTTRVVTDYTLSGTLTEGTSIVTVSYGGKTTTFNVTVSHSSTEYTYEIVGTGLVNTSGGVGNNTSYSLTSFFELDPSYSVLTVTHDTYSSDRYFYIQFFNGDTFVDRQAIGSVSTSKRRIDYSSLGTVTKARISFNPTTLTNVKIMKGLV